jgi:formamidopyrimidine-DNA glycosylase
VPEGDTIFRTARSLHHALAGRAVERFEAPRLAGPHPSPGTRISGVEAVGKHLFVNFDGGLAVYGRTGRPCRRCRTPIRSRRQGAQARTTYWCPECQR